MKHIINFACVMILFITITTSSAGCPRGETNFCSNVRCIGVPSAEECKPGQKFVEYDPKNCVCCSYCQNITSSENHSAKTKDKRIPSQCSADKDPATFCQLVDCQPTATTPADCTKDQIFAEVDHSKCICCTQCINKHQSNCKN